MEQKSDFLTDAQRNAECNLKLHENSFVPLQNHLSRWSKRDYRVTAFDALFPFSTKQCNLTYSFYLERSNFHKIQLNFVIYTYRRNQSHIKSENNKRVTIKASRIFFSFGLMDQCCKITKTPLVKLYGFYVIMSNSCREVVTGFHVNNSTRTLIDGRGLYTFVCCNINETCVSRAYGLIFGIKIWGNICRLVFG